MNNIYGLKKTIPEDFPEPTDGFTYWLIYHIELATIHTPPKFNIAPEKSWWEDYFPIGKVTFQGLC